MDAATVSVAGPGDTVTQKRQLSGAIEITFASGRSLRLSNFLAAYVDTGDQIKFALPCNGQAPTAPELLIKHGTGTYLYQASIGYATKPKIDKFHHPYVHAEIAGGALGLIGLHLTCAALRAYFYSPDRNRHQVSHTLYDSLRA